MGRGSSGEATNVSAQTRSGFYQPNQHDIDEYMHGQCAAWAIGHHQRHPHLSFGLHFEFLDDAASEKEAIENGEEWDGVNKRRIQHVFTHDEHYAYDAAGRHAMPYNDFDESEFGIKSQREIEMTGMVESGYIPEEHFFTDNDPHDKKPLPLSRLPEYLKLYYQRELEAS